MPELIVITGTRKGIGRYLAEYYAKQGYNTIVVANSLVNRRFPANVIVQGNPAKIIFKREQSRE